MAEVTLATLATKGAPSMVAGTEEAAYVSFISTHGPYKTETVLFQQDASNDFKADDTFKSRLAHPLFVTAVIASDAGTGLVTFSAELTSDESNANFKQITLRDAEGVDGLGVVITIYGF